MHLSRIKIKLTLSILVFFSINTVILAQKTRSFVVQFHLQYGEEVVELETGNYQHQQKELNIEIFKCYLTNFTLQTDNKVVWEESDSYHLLDAEVPNSFVLKFDLPKKLRFSQLHFNLGVDSTTSVSGAMGGDLDPTKGMYWTWNSGYINFKLEGISPLCPTRHNRFQLHLGGYNPPFNALQSISLATCSKDRLAIFIQVDKFLEALDLSQQHSVMIPSEEAVEMARLAAKAFVVE